MIRSLFYELGDVILTQGQTDQLNKRATSLVSGTVEGCKKSLNWRNWSQFTKDTNSKRIFSKWPSIAFTTIQ